MPAVTLQRTTPSQAIASGEDAPQATRFQAAVAIGGPIAALFGLIALVGYLFFRSVSLEHDATSRAADMSAMEQSLSAEIDMQETMTIEFGYWDASFENTTLAWNEDFVRNTFYSEHDDTQMIIAPDRTVRYGWSHPRHGADGAARLAAALALVPEGLTRDSFIEGPDQTVVAQSHLGLYKGAPLVVTVMPIHPEDPDLLMRQSPDQPTDFLIISRTLAIPHLTAIGRRIGLSELHFSEAPDRGTARASLPVQIPGEAPVGYVSWLDRQPGTAMFNRHIGGLLTGFALLSLLAALAIARSVRSSLEASDAARVTAETARRAAEHANAAKSQFLATMSHELRTPLNAIIGYSEILAENAEGDRRQGDARDAGRITAAGHHLLSMINQILDHAAIEADTISFQAVAVSLVETAEDVAAMVAPIASSQGTELALASHGLVVPALADPVRVRQCLLNVIGNAVKFTRGGKVQVDCRRTWHEGRDWVLITVSDTGVGMSPDTLARLFTPFLQADGSDARRFEGTGLGLAITKRLMDGMNGQIEVTSTLGVGTTVSLRFPVFVEQALAAAA